MTEPCCTPLVTGAGNAPGGLVVNVTCGDPVNLTFEQCVPWPLDLVATLRLSHPWGWDMEVTGSVDDVLLLFHISIADAREIPRDSAASVVLAYPGVDPFTWLSGGTRHSRGRC